MNADKPTNGRKLPLDTYLESYGTTVGEAFIAEICAGESIKTALDKVGASRYLLARWCADDPAFGASYARALEVHNDIKGDSLLTAHVDIEDVNKARIYSENVKWVLSKRDRRYSDKLQLEVEQRVSIADALQEAQSRVLSASYRTLPDSPIASAESTGYAVGAIDTESVPATSPESVAPPGIDSTDPELAFLLS